MFSTSEKLQNRLCQMFNCAKKVEMNYRVNYGVGREKETVCAIAIRIMRISNYVTWFSCQIYLYALCVRLYIHLATV